MLNIYKLFVAVTSDLNLMTRFTYAFCYKQINFVIFLSQREMRWLLNLQCKKEYFVVGKRIKFLFKFCT